MFLSRVTIKESSISKLGSVCRRIYRIFSHAYYHHRRIYDLFEVRIRVIKFYKRQAHACRSENEQPV